MACKSLRVAGLVPESIVDGPGLRYTVFTQGCPHCCPGCHNPETHDFAGGYDAAIADILGDMDQDPLLAGLTLSGGEPFCQAGPCADLAEQARARGRNVMVYSGYVYEDLLVMAETDPDVGRLLAATDILVDGPYIEEQRDLTLEFRGSGNQRVIYLS